jgi:hypothetical protein
VAGPRLSFIAQYPRFVVATGFAPAKEFRRRNPAARLRAAEGEMKTPRRVKGEPAWLLGMDDEGFDKVNFGALTAQIKAQIG